MVVRLLAIFFFFQAEDGIRDLTVTGVQTCALPISKSFRWRRAQRGGGRYRGGRDDPGERCEHGCDWRDHRCKNSRAHSVSERPRAGPEERIAQRRVYRWI